MFIAEPTSRKLRCEDLFSPSASGTCYQLRTTRSGVGGRVQGGEDSCWLQQERQMFVVVHIDSKHHLFRVACSEEVHCANAYGQVVATRHLPRNLAHARVSHSRQGSYNGLWSVRSVRLLKNPLTRLTTWNEVLGDSNTGLTRSESQFGFRQGQKICLPHRGWGLHVFPFKVQRRPFQPMLPATQYNVGRGDMRKEKMSFNAFSDRDEIERFSNFENFMRFIFTDKYIILVQ